MLFILWSYGLRDRAAFYVVTIITEEYTYVVRHLHSEDENMILFRNYNSTLFHNPTTTICLSSIGGVLCGNFYEFPNFIKDIRAQLHEVSYKGYELQCEKASVRL